MDVTDRSAYVRGMGSKRIETILEASRHRAPLVARCCSCGHKADVALEPILRAGVPMNTAIAMVPRAAAAQGRPLACSQCGSRLVEMDWRMPRLFIP